MHTSTARVSHSRVLLVACLGAFLAFLDATIVNVAFPSMKNAFAESSISSLSWVLNGYNIVFAAFLIVFGRLTDLIGRRRAFIGGVAVFTIASGLCGTASTVGILVLWRVVQALGAAMLVPAMAGRRYRSCWSSRRAVGRGPSWSTCPSGSSRSWRPDARWSRAEPPESVRCPISWVPPSWRPLWGP